MGQIIYEGISYKSPVEMLTLIIHQMNETVMNRELYKPIARAMTALFLVVLVKFAAVLTLKSAVEFYSFVDIALSLAVVIILLNFRIEFNRLIAEQDSRSIVTGLVIALVLITLYISFRHYSDFLPYGSYHIFFFLLLMIPIYSLWEVLHKNTDRLSDFFILAEKRITCSCGWENPDFNRYCGGCGSPLPHRRDSQ